MSNFQSIATVTAALQRELQDAINSALSGADATVTRPAATGMPDKGVNIFLYQVTSNAARRNADLPHRDSDGIIAQRPRAALDLHYLLSFYGDETKLEPQLLLGSVTRRLHSSPILTDTMVSGMLGDPKFSFLAGSDLADETEPVRFTPLGLSLEELSKLWSVFFQTTYALSVAYQASVVLIEGTERAHATLPVRERTLTVLPFHSPDIKEIESELGPNLPILPGGIITIRGRNLRGDVTRVAFNGIEETPLAPNVSDDEIKIGLPPNLRAGINSIQIVHKLMLGIPPAEHHGFESKVAALVLSPTITNIAVTSVPADAFIIDLAPTLRVSQRAVLLLNNVTTGATYAFPIKPLAADTAQVRFPVPLSGATAIDSGPYFVRVQVDGAETSLLDLNPLSPTFKQLIASQVTIP
jgi:hypothetical protein